MNREIQGIILAIVIVSSIVSIFLLVKGVKGEPFDAIGLLDQNCKLENYPSQLALGSNVTFCIFIENHMYRVEYYKIIYKIGINTTLPNNETPSPEPPLREWRIVLASNHNTTIKVTVPFKPPEKYQLKDKVALIFELWRYNTKLGEWEYSGRWVHLYVTPFLPIIPGG